MKPYANPRSRANEKYESYAQIGAYAGIDIERKYWDLTYPLS